MSTLATASFSADTFTPLTSRLKTSWDNATELDRQKCEEKARQGCLLVCEVVAPNARHDRFDALCKSRPKETDDDISKEFTLLMTAYRDAPTKTVKLQILRSSAPKKRPMIFRQKIKSADFYFSSRGSQILFQNVFILIQFCFFPKISTHDVVWSVGTQITPKISPFEIPSEFIIATQNNKKNYTGIKKRAF